MSYLCSFVPLKQLTYQHIPAVVYGAFTAGKYSPLHVGSTRYGFVPNVKATLRSILLEEMMVVTVLDSGISRKHCLGNYKLCMYVCMYVYHVRVVNTNSLCLLHAYKLNQSRSMVSPHNGSISLCLSLYLPLL